jgi:hypothetical protein
LTAEEKILFEKLKQAVAKTFLQENTALSADISQWKGDDIVTFQEDLLHKVKGRVSEKWFYNYFRNDVQKLPRIDMLNLLSEYTGYQNWADFKQQNSPKPQKNSKIKTKGISFIGGILVGLAILLAWQFSKPSAKKVHFCFVDEMQSPVNDVKVTLILENESEKMLKLKENCIDLRSLQEQIKLKITSPYFENIVINRNIAGEDYSEQIVLQTDLHSLMIRHYSNSESQNWQKRREKLEQSIADDAVIYQQWFGDKKGIEIYSKTEFIEQLTIPTSLLRNIEILEIAYKDNKVVKLRFVINPKNKK